MLKTHEKVDIMHNIPAMRGMRVIQHSHPKTLGYSRLLDTKSKVAVDGKVINSVASLERSQPVVKVKLSDYDLKESGLDKACRPLNDQRISDENLCGQSMGPHTKNSSGFSETAFHFDDIVSSFPADTPEESVNKFWNVLDKHSKR